MRKWSEIDKLLNKAPDPQFVKAPNEKAGIYGPYLEAQFVVSELNRIFGVDGWDGEIISTDRIHRDDLSVVFTTTYKIMAGGLDDKEPAIATYVSRSNGGVGVASPIKGKDGTVYPPKPQALDTAFKAAVSDSIKRTAKDFGFALGLALYFDDKELTAMHAEAPDKDGSGNPIDPKSSKTQSMADTTTSAQTGAEIGGEDHGPFVYPKKDYKDACAGKLNEHGKIEAGVLVEVVGEEAYGYLNWLWPKQAASDKKWDVQAGNELKAWLDKNAPKKEAASPKATQSTTTVSENKSKSIKGSLVTLLKSAKDEDKVSIALVAPLKQYMAETIYGKDGAPNDFHINGLLRKPEMGLGEHANLNSLTVKQAKALVNYVAYLIENGGESAKEYGQSVLAIALADKTSWKEACDLYSAGEKTVDFDALVKAINPKMALSDCEPILHAFGWPTPIPATELENFLRAVKTNGWELFDNSASGLAKAVATAWTK
jgi:hypothetical protein